MGRPAGAVVVRMTYNTQIQGGRELGDAGGDPNLRLVKLPDGEWTTEWVPIR